MSDARAAPRLVELVVEAEGWALALPDLADLAEAAARRALAASGREPEAYEIALLACDDARIAALNAAFRGKEAPTNVLSWPAFETLPPPGAVRESALASDPAARRTPLGDVAIALETVRREAEAASLPLKDHAIHLILHGCLHLLGYDHATEAEADLMEGIETRALAELGIDDPYSRGDAAHPHPD